MPEETSLSKQWHRGASSDQCLAAGSHGKPRWLWKWLPSLIQNEVETSKKCGSLRVVDLVNGGCARGLPGIYMYADHVLIWETKSNAIPFAQFTIWGY